MFITTTVTKKILEAIIHETFIKFGNVSSSCLLDSLKFLGFYYATSAGLSINIEDLKTPISKKEIIGNISKEINKTSEDWQNGKISEIERFQTIIDGWNYATETLKNRIVDYYQIFDPANTLYIMAFSGARGNMSQVRQLVGMRGLMSDQEGNIIDIPIQANFREGLSSLDYIISSYGARKGIVDTALKTADSGYLTRRLIYVAQDLVIREIDCKTKKGILFTLKKTTDCQNIYGRVLVHIKFPLNLNNSNLLENEIIDEKFIKFLKKDLVNPIWLVVRSTLTCESNNSICQKCYGYDLSQNQFISLGETVGITAAQSIGEPGTQLTMRTFHTGGIFTSQLQQQTLAPFSGRITYPKRMRTYPYRNSHGMMVFKLKQEISATLTNWKGETQEVSVPSGSFLYNNVPSFVKKGDVIAEASLTESNRGNRKLKPVYASLDAEVLFENIVVRSFNLGKRQRTRVSDGVGVLWLAAGKVFPIPKQASLNFSKRLNTFQSIANLKLITPIEGIIYIKNESILIVNQNESIEIDFSYLVNTIKNCRVELVPTVKNYQYVDPHTIIAFFYIYPNVNENVFLIRKKDTKSINLFFLITESDIWRINSEQLNSFVRKKKYIRSGTYLNSTTKFLNSGLFLKKDGFQFIFQKANPIFVTRKAILNYTQGDIVLKNQVLATLIQYQQQTEDIVQGLPKVEEILEARIPKHKSQLSKNALVSLPCMKGKILKESFVKDEIYFYVYKTNLEYVLRKRGEKTQRELKKEMLYKQSFFFHNPFLKDKYVFHENKLWKIQKSSQRFSSLETWSKKEEGYMYPFLLTPDKKTKIYWLKYNTDKNVSSKEIETSNRRFELSFINPIEEYDILKSLNEIRTPGKFFDIGEPLTDGLIDPHELLHIIYTYHSKLDGTLLGTLRSINKFQLILLNSVQGIYTSQGVNISSKHIEVVVRQMTTKVMILNSGNTPFLPSEIIPLSLVVEVTKAYKQTEKRKSPVYEPKLLSMTTSSLSKDGFLSAAGFQETKRVLLKAAIEGTKDWFRGLKESIIIGRIIPAGSSFLRYKNYLDTIYYFKKKNQIQNTEVISSYEGFSNETRNIEIDKKLIYYNEKYKNIYSK